MPLDYYRTLSNDLGEERKELLYRAVFAFDPEEKEDANRALLRHNLWPRLDELLRSVTVVDPACGSGSFLVGMLYVLDDLLKRANDQLGREETPYERKKRIIGRSLYGVDVMGWAVRVAELRLWLQLVIETDMEPAELQFRPLLPNLSFKIRQGDSLVQEVGGVNLAQRSGTRDLSPQLKGKITRLKGEKIKYFNNESDARLRTEQQVRQAEVELFYEILFERKRAIDERLAEIKHALDSRTNLFGEDQGTQGKLDEAALKRERDRLQDQKKQVQQAQKALADAHNVPFVWDISFVEIFSGESGGFDIVIGNPPYVRQEHIRDPRLAHEQVTRQNKKEYKAKLAHSVYTAWPQTFGYEIGKNKVRWKLDKKSDLYIYFYFHGLSLLNDRGTFCFITSNSWLDVGYGADLQGFLLKRGQATFIIDNQKRRSFASADVNTVITLFGSAHDRSVHHSVEQAEHVARFVMLKVPFEQVLSPIIWEEIEEADDRTTKPEYRVMPLSQVELLNRGLSLRSKKFDGDKWGGKYLRAPDIYWAVMEKAGDKFVRLGEVADVRFGIKTGANKFFYLDQNAIRRWGIEQRFLAPVVKSPRELSSITIDPTQLKLRLFMCHFDRAELQGTAALEYIKSGESQNLHKRPSVASRANWWDVGTRTPGLWAWPYVMRARIFAPYNPNREVYFDNNFFDIHPSNSDMGIGLFLNSTFHNLQLEIHARAYGGGGGPIKTQVYELENMKAVILPEGDILPGVEGLKHMDALPVWKTIKLPERQVIDSIVFDFLGLTQGERDAIYEAVLTLVESRLSKAVSL